MMYVGVRGDNSQLSANFTSTEFECTCRGKCGIQLVWLELVEKLQALRDMVGPIHITSGYRCAEKQAELRTLGYETAKGVSSHEKGLAADIHITGDRETFLKHIHSLFDNVGEASTWVHVDIRPGGPRRWTYKS